MEVVEEGRSLQNTSDISFNFLQRNFCNILDGQKILQIVLVMAELNWIYNSTDVVVT